jgi:hypothetical protein
LLNVSQPQVSHGEAQRKSFRGVAACAAKPEPIALTGAPAGGVHIARVQFSGPAQGAHLEKLELALRDALRTQPEPLPVTGQGATLN